MRVCVFYSHALVVLYISSYFGVHVHYTPYLLRPRTRGGIVSHSSLKGLILLKHRTCDCWGDGRRLYVEVDVYLFP